jgi:CheY-like chemotaxis protein
MSDKKKILVVEDEKALSAALKDKLEEIGFEVLMAENGKEGLNASFNKKPSLILLDIIMPVMDGISMLRNIRHLGEWGKKVPIIILSNLADINVDGNKNKGLKEFMEENIVTYLIKSESSLEDIVKKIEDTLK